ncbi:MAG: hypothetical protein GX639_01200 [Fibrobacter sp.]|nr:hypothetical protein [Fibrobacter sp.]
MINTNDTSDFAEKIMVDAYRKMSPRQKIQQVVSLTQTVQKMALTRLRDQYGPMTEQEEKLRLASLWLPPKTMIRLFNWNPEEKGY